MGTYRVTISKNGRPQTVWLTVTGPDETWNSQLQQEEDYWRRKGCHVVERELITITQAQSQPAGTAYVA